MDYAGKNRPTIDLMDLGLALVGFALVAIAVGELLGRWIYLATFQCELGRGQPVFVRAASWESCPNAQLFVDGGTSDA